jgi:uncharacterized protein with von Willebrand factor type A (vWA) domain
MDAAVGPIERIAGFAALLREHGLKVGVAEQQAMVRAAALLPLERPALINGAWRAIACHDARDWRRWPDLFQRYWHPERARGSTRVSGNVRQARNLQQLVHDLHQELGATRPRAGQSDVALQAPPEVTEDGGARARGGASRAEALEDRTLAEWLPQDLSELERLARRIAARLRRRLTRRWRADPAGCRLDVRRTLRASLRTGGLPLAPAWRARRRERPRLFLLVDVSRSMQTHAQLFLRIARAFVTAIDARVFVFHTRLAEVTALLRGDSAAIQEKVNAVTAGFGGGTRIATSVGDFHRVHARAQLSRRARIWVLSDGFDADEPALLAEQLGHLRRRGARITWLHPSERRPNSQAIETVDRCRGLVERYLRLNTLRDLAAVGDLVD